MSIFNKSGSTDKVELTEPIEEETETPETQETQEPETTETPQTDESTTDCTEGWKCKTPYYKAYQNSDCSWESIEACVNGCEDGECIAADSD